MSSSWVIACRSPDSGGVPASGTDRLPVRDGTLPHREHRARSLLLALAGLGLVIPVCTRAQATRHYVGFAAGATYSQVTDYLTDLDWRWGGAAGLLLGVAALDYTYLELAPAWTRVGGGYIRLDYLDVPVMLGARLPLGSSSRLARLYGGLNFGLKTGCGAGQTTVCDIARSTVWSALFGLGVVKVAPGGRFVGIDVRYVVGLSTIFDFRQRITQRSWQCRALLGLPLGHP